MAGRVRKHIREGIREQPEPAGLCQAHSRVVEEEEGARRRRQLTEGNWPQTGWWPNEYSTPACWQRHFPPSRQENPHCLSELPCGGAA